MTFNLTTTNGAYVSNPCRARHDAECEVLTVRVMRCACPCHTGPVVYLSGPTTGLAEFNRPAFYAAEAALRARGFTVLNPARDVEPRPYQEYLRRDIVELLTGADGLVMLPGWEESTGAKVEHAVATACGLWTVDLADEGTLDYYLEVWTGSRA